MQLVLLIKRQGGVDHQGRETPQEADPAYRF